MHIDCDFPDEIDDPDPAPPAAPSDPSPGEVVGFACPIGIRSSGGFIRLGRAIGAALLVWRRRRAAR